MQPIIVFDLRNRHLAAGIIDSPNGKLRWKPEMIQIYQREDGSPDPVLEADLCFFQPLHDNKKWTPILSVGLDHLPAGYKGINDLFGWNDKEQMRDAIKTGLYPLMSPLLSGRKELEILFLVDSFQIGEYLTEISQKLKRPNRVIVAPTDSELLGGYALLDIDQTLQSQEGKILTCAIGEKLQSYQWKNNGFEVVSSKKAQPESRWDGYADLERVGLVAFEMIWSVNLISTIQTRLEELNNENNLLSNLLEKMDKVCGELRGLSRRKPVQSV